MGKGKGKEHCDVARTVKRAFNLINAHWHTHMHTQQRNCGLMRRGLTEACPALAFIDKLNEIGPRKTS